MKIVVPGMKIDSMDLITVSAEKPCDQEIAEPRSGGGSTDPLDRVTLCVSLGILRW